MNDASPYAAALYRIPVRESSVSVLGSDTRFWTYGHDTAETTVLLVHGYRGDHHGLEPVVAQMPHVRFIAPDLPGFGESSPLIGRKHDIEGYRDWLLEFVRELELEEVPVLGHSFGSIVVSAAVSAGMRPPRAVLVNPIAIAGTKGPRPVATALTVGFYRVASTLPEGAARAVLSSRAIVRGMSTLMAKTKDRALRRWIHGQHRAYFSRFASKQTLLEGFEASISRSVGEFAATMPVPTLLVAADRDDITPLSANRALAAALPDARLVVLEGVGHLIHYERPVEAAAAIEQFLGHP